MKSGGFRYASTVAIIEPNRNLVYEEVRDEDESI